MRRGSRQPRFPSAAIRRLAVALALVGAAAAGGALAGPAPEAARIVAIGDVHGAGEELQRLLRAVGLIDEGGSWSGGRDILIQTGDFMDRGPAVREIMELFIRLQGEARAAGGRVVVLLGNHEVLNLVGAHQYMSPESLSAFADRSSEARLAAAFREHERRVLRRQPGWRRADSRTRREVEAEWLGARPPGWVEFLQALEPDGSFGRWLRRLPAVHREGAYLFLHAGIPPELAGHSVAAINARIHDEIAALDRYRNVLRGQERLPAASDLEVLLDAADAGVGGLADLAAEPVEPGLPALPAPDAPVEQELFYAPLARLDEWFLFAPDGPMWFRGYARWDERELQERLPSLLEELDARALVVGHTPQTGGVRVRGDGALYLIDTGMLEATYGGHGEALVLSDDRAVAVSSSGARRDLPAPTARAASPHR